MRKLTNEQIVEARHLRSQGVSLTTLGKRFGVHFTTVALWTGDEEKRRIKLMYKRTERVVERSCGNCGIALHGKPESACDCRFPSTLRRYFFSPKELRSYNGTGGIVPV